MRGSQASGRKRERGRRKEEREGARLSGKDREREEERGRSRHSIVGMVICLSFKQQMIAFLLRVLEAGRRS